jgi:hypothetical protein
VRSLGLGREWCVVGDVARYIRTGGNSGPILYDEMKQRAIVHVCSEYLLL